VVTAIGPVDAEAGTVAVIVVSEFTAKVLVTPLNVTAVAPVNPEPLMVTLVPMVPTAGLKEEMAGAVARAGAAVAIIIPTTIARAPRAEERR
jgi:hypothetical protein